MYCIIIKVSRFIRLHYKCFDKFIFEIRESGPERSQLSGYFSFFLPCWYNKNPKYTYKLTGILIFKWTKYNKCTYSAVIKYLCKSERRRKNVPPREYSIIVHNSLLYRRSIKWSCFGGSILMSQSNNQLIILAIFYYHRYVMCSSVP